MWILYVLGIVIGLIVFYLARDLIGTVWDWAIQPAVLIVGKKWVRYLGTKQRIWSAGTPARAYALYSEILQARPRGLGIHRSMLPVRQQSARPLWLDPQSYR